MPEHAKFKYASLEELKADRDRLGLELPFAEESSALFEPFELHGKRLPNRIVAHPMEGSDGQTSGGPSELTRRRYLRFAAGGAGLLWFEACAVCPEGRANPRQLWITRENVGQFRDLLAEAHQAAARANGDDHRPFTVLQLTHSGRYSRPTAAGPAPLIAAENPFLDPKLTAPARLVTDEELEALEERFVEAALLAREAGFDAVDVKACHRYLLNELLSAHTRPGRYGGSFENRIRLLVNVVEKIKKACPDLAVSLRMNAYDGTPYPYGWGVDPEDHRRAALAEPLRLLGILRSLGVRLVNVTIGNPYYAPHINRPYDLGAYRPTEHPLEGVVRILGLGRRIQEALPDMNVVATGFSWLRQFGAQAAAGCVRDGWFGLVGFGRQMFAYPDLPADLRRDGALNPKKCCIACSKCSEIMRYGGDAGCVIRDAELYAPIYKAITEGKPPASSTRLAEHV